MICNMHTHTHTHIPQFLCVLPSILSMGRSCLMCKYTNTIHTPKKMNTPKKQQNTTGRRERCRHQSTRCWVNVISRQTYGRFSSREQVIFSFFINLFVNLYIYVQIVYVYVQYLSICLYVCLYRQIERSIDMLYVSIDLHIHAYS